MTIPYTQKDETPGLLGTVFDWQATEWEEEVVETSWSERRGSEYEVDWCRVKEAEVLIGPSEMEADWEIVDRKTLIQLVGAMKVAQAEEDKTNDMEIA